MTIDVKDANNALVTRKTLDDITPTAALNTQLRDAAGVAVAVAAGAGANGLRVVHSTDDVVLGPVTETAPASDTASSGLNGRLQRLAQRVTSLIGLFPTSLGAKTSAASLSVTLASDQVVATNADSGVVPAAAPSKSLLVSGRYNASAPTATDGQVLPLQVDANGILKVSSTGGSSASINRVKLTPTVTVTAATYAALQSVGGLVTLANAARVAAGGGDVTAITLDSASTTAINATIRVWFFDANPTGSTFTDNGTFNIVAADVPKVIGYEDVALWASGGSSNASIGKTGSVSLPFKLASGTTVYMAMQTLAAAVFSGTGVLSANVNILQD